MTSALVRVSMSVPELAVAAVVVFVIGVIVGVTVTISAILDWRKAERARKEGTS